MSSLGRAALCTGAIDTASFAFFLIHGQLQGSKVSGKVLARDLHRASAADHAAVFKTAGAAQAVRHLALKVSSLGTYLGLVALKSTAIPPLHKF
jgi:hypothetical protein